MTRRKPVATVSIAVGQSTRASAPSRRTIGCSNRPSSPIVSPSAAPFEHNAPKFAGCIGSPTIATPPRSPGVATTPHPTPQYGHAVRTLAG